MIIPQTVYVEIHIEPTRRDYWVSAMIRASLPEDTTVAVWRPYRLWTRRIQASDLSQARAAAIRLIESMLCEYSELQILWDTAEPFIVQPEPSHAPAVA